jgi:hypothetical protein
MEPKYYHLIIYCPVEAADRVRRALADAGAGEIGNYDSCSFSSRGTGRFRGNETSKPTVGTPGKLEQVKEERIEVVAPKEKLQEILRAAVKAHPYEEPAIHVLPMLDYKDFL